MDEDNLEIIVTPGNWQIPGRPPRWNWQVRQKEPSKFLVKGVTMDQNTMLMMRRKRLRQSFWRG
jgi:hypothetical protein